MRSIVTAVVTVAMLLPGVAFSALGISNQSFNATLLSPISTKTSREGDKFTARVNSPAKYRGAILRGTITKLKPAGRGFGKKRSEIAFQFETLTYRKGSHPVTADLTEVANSKGVSKVDDEGNAVGKKSLKKPFLGAAIGAAGGAVIGAITGGGAGKGAAIGAGAGLVVGLTMTTQGENIEFRPGSKFTLTVSDRDPGRGRSPDGGRRH